MKTKLLLKPDEKLIIPPEWIGGRASLAETLTSFLNAMRGQEKFKFSPYDFALLCRQVNRFFREYNTLTRFFEVNTTLIGLLDKTIVELKKRPKTAEEMEKYREALKKAIIIYRTAADDVTTDDIPGEERRLYNYTYAFMAKKYLAEYLERPLETLTDADTYPEYAKLYDWAYNEMRGIYNKYAIPYREGRTRADSLTSTDDDSRDTEGAGETEPLLITGLRQRR